MVVERNKSSEVERIIILMEEIALIKSRIQPQATGHLHTAVNVLQERVEELQNNIENKMRKLQNG